MTNTSSADVRRQLIHTLRLDLVGPSPDDADRADEVLPQAPSRFYTFGFLAPSESSYALRSDEGFEEEVDTLQDGSNEEQGSPDKRPKSRVPFPSSIGLSVLVGPDAESLDVHVSWGEYRPVLSRVRRELSWRRASRTAAATIDVTRSGKQPLAEGVYLLVKSRRVRVQDLAPGTRALSLFVINARCQHSAEDWATVRRPADIPMGETEAPRILFPEDIEWRERAFMFQVRLTAQTEGGFVARPNRPLDSGDEDELRADVQYRDDAGYAIGHNVSVKAERAGDLCRHVETCWMPLARVPRTEHRGYRAMLQLMGVEAGDRALTLDTLAKLEDHDQARAILGPMVDAYRHWIVNQPMPSDDAQRATAQHMLTQAKKVAKRIHDGIAALKSPRVLQAFKLTNQVMRTAMMRQSPRREPAWYPFQLAFLLMNLNGAADPSHKDREQVDLLFFPTGGGKTEAYLGLAAFTLITRRMQNPGVKGAGVTVIMRYTLRLLTLDQLSRAATLICALELARQADPALLGTWPFEIGLWVGEAATPNTMLSKKTRKGVEDKSAEGLVRAYRSGGRGSRSPVPLKSCPWSRAAHNHESFGVVVQGKAPRLEITCADEDCVFNLERLPILAVDEEIYRRAPAFLIATVDKFAALPWVAESGVLLGHSTRHTEHGFFGSASKAQGKKLTLLPPALIIQDELHLISGPLGTMVGLYETAIDELCVRGDIKPKIVASTATVKAAKQQIRALFARKNSTLFPPPGLSRHDNFFAYSDVQNPETGRLYLGIGAKGRNQKVVLLRTYLALLGAAQKAWARNEPGEDNPADPYMTVLGYFLSLRELGGSRRIVEDEVTGRATNLSARRRVGEDEGLFSSRACAMPVELTSRVSMDDVALAKDALSRPTRPDDHLDVALATNMISVGLDISRLGLMVCLGQPQTAAEYIQTTSRVGRDAKRPGLVVTLLNMHRARDRSHFEQFQFWHESYYGFVEATSVTPFSSRALDRGLRAVAVALARHLVPALTADKGAVHMKDRRAEVEPIAARIAARFALNVPVEDRERLKAEVCAIFDAWQELAAQTPKLSYTGKDGRLLWTTRAAERSKKVLRDPFIMERSLRDVEPSTPLLFWEQDA